MYVCDQEKTQNTVKLAKMNLAVNGLRGEIKQVNTYTKTRMTASARSITCSPIRRSTSTT